MKTCKHTIHCSFVNLRGSMVSLYGSMVSLHGSMVNLHDSFESLYSSRFFTFMRMRIRLLT